MSGALLFKEEVPLGDADVAAYTVQVEAIGLDQVRVSIAAQCLQPLRLHWATAESAGDSWLPAPPGWTTRPPHSFDGGGGAWVTEFSLATQGVQQVEVKLHAKRRVFAFVLRTHHDRFIKRGGQDMYVPTSPTGATAARVELPAPCTTPPCVLPSLPGLPVLTAEVSGKTQGATLLHSEEVTMADEDVAGYAVRAVTASDKTVRVALAVATREPLRLHWGITKRPGGKWRMPLSGCEDGEHAQVTDFEGDVALRGLQSVQLELPRRGFLAFVFRTIGDRFIKQEGHDMHVPLGEKRELSAREDKAPPRAQKAPLVAETEKASPAIADVKKSPASEHKARQRGLEKNESKHSQEAAQAQKETEATQEPVAREHRCLDDLGCDHGALEATGAFSGAIVDQIARGELECQRSLMHRYNFAAGLIDKAAKEGQSGLVVVFAWFRFMAMRQLVINRNYNVKPREISSAQDKVTQQLAEMVSQRPDLQDVVRLTMTSIGRGGAGDVGQRIRDEILEVQKRNNCKGGMMEEWHQKLHNNTCPDDVAICEALLEYIGKGLDIKAYWSRLAQDHITRQRLASYNRKICSEPRFQPEQCAGLARDLREYLRTLKAVHSGVDMESAANAVMGYSHSSRKGGARHCEPVPGIESTRLRRCISAALQGVATSQECADLLPAVEAMVEARWELRPWIIPGSQRHERTKDVLYLDLALETAIRGAMERSLANLASRPLAEVLAMAELGLENLTLSAGANRELLLCLKEWRSAGMCGGSELPLRVKAVMDRLQRELAARSDRIVGALQPPSAALGARLGVAKDVLATFSEEVVRGGAAAPVAQLLRALDPMLRKLGNLGAWQVISPVEACGRLVRVPSLASLQHKAFAEPTVLLAERVGGEEDIPEGVVAVLTPDMPDVLSHVAVRARNERRLFASILDAAVLQHIAALEHNMVHCKPSPAADSVAVDCQGEEGSTAVLADVAAATGPRTQICCKSFCGRFALTSADFGHDVAGGKSCNLQRLRGRVPAFVGLPASVVIPFGAFEATLGDARNADTSRQLCRLEAQLRQAAPEAVAECLAEVRDAVHGLQVPQHMTEALRQAFGSEGLFWPGDLDGGARGAAAWKAIKGVWASKWSDAAYASCLKTGLNHADLSMAVLCQQVVDARYSFVIHTTNPTTADAGELFAELVCGLGETLVGNYAGRALSFVASKHNPDAVEVRGFPSKRVGLFIQRSTVIFRSDSNGEDLEGYAGAGLYDSVVMDSSVSQHLDYSCEPLVVDREFRVALLRKIANAGVCVERAMGCAQDIEGVIDNSGELVIVQTRPQV